MREQGSSIGSMDFSPELYASLGIWGQFNGSEADRDIIEYSAATALRFAGLEGSGTLETLDILGFLEAREDEKGKMYFPSDEKTVRYAEEIMDYIEKEYGSNIEAFLEMFDDWDREQLHNRFQDI